MHSVVQKKDIMKQLTTLIISLFFFTNINCQTATSMTAKETLPYHQIPEAPTDYSSGNVIARMIDGLGYRYYWATEGLRTEDLSYRPSEDASNVTETLDHLFGLSVTILNATTSTPNIRPYEKVEMTDTEKRVMTLKNFKAASDQLKGADETTVSKMKVIFKRGEQTSEFPFWNNINGPIADAIYHTGQIVSFRRTSGNPVNSKMNVFIGKTKE